LALSLDRVTKVKAKLTVPITMNTQASTSKNKDITAPVASGSR
jgi:hypothetical protein